VIIFLNPALLQPRLSKEAIDFMTLKSLGSFLDLGSDSLGPALIAADLSGCVAQVFIKHTMDFSDWAELIGQAEIEDYAKRRSNSSRVQVVREHLNQVNGPLRLYGSFEGEGNVTHVLFPFSDTNDRDLLKYTKRVLMMIISQTPMKMLACFLNPKTLSSKY